MHILFALIVGATITDINFTRGKTFKKDLSCQVDVSTYCDNKLQNTIIALSPLFALLIPIILFFFGLYTTSIVVGGYMVLSIKIVLPSKVDIQTMRDFKTDEELTIIMEKSLPK
ncbi:MAG: hypothetical protein GTO02_07705 [Candidatus Dadabacteria bacterium]|nr:hypothetical protein [Candidatus Dadabacteria bacterium]